MSWISAITKSKKFHLDRKTGYLLIIISSALAALLHVVGKPLLETSDIDIGLNPVVLAMAIFIINGLFFTPLCKNSGPIRKIGSKNLILLGFIGIAEVLALITYLFGLKDATAINASIFSNGEIIFSLLIAITVFRERLTKKELTPFCMIVFGMILLPIGYDFYQHGLALDDLVFGDLLIIGSGFLYALDINACKYVSNKFDCKRITQLTSFASGGFALLVLLVFQIPIEINLSQLPAIAVLAILGTGISTLFFLLSLKLIGAVRTIMLYSTTSIFGIIFSIILLGEELTIVNIISVTIVMIGIYLLRNRLGGEDSEPVNTSVNIENSNLYKKSMENKRPYPDIFLHKIRYVFAKII